MGKLVNGHLGGWNSCRMKCNHSTDLCENWSESRYLHNVRNWKIRNKPVRMSNRNIILPICIELFFYKSTFLVCSKKKFVKGVIESRWAKLENIKSGILQLTVIELSIGILLAYHRITKGGLNRGRIAKSESKDYGLHRSTAIPTNHPNHNS